MLERERAMLSVELSDLLMDYGVERKLAVLAARCAQRVDIPEQLAVWGEVTSREYLQLTRLVDRMTCQQLLIVEPSGDGVRYACAKCDLIPGAVSAIDWHKGPPRRGFCRKLLASDEIREAVTLLVNHGREARRGKDAADDTAARRREWLHRARARRGH